MNIFRKHISDDTIKNYETQLLDFETQLAGLVEQNKQFSNQIIELTNKLITNEETLQVKEVAIEEKQEQINDLEEKIQESAEVIEEVIESIDTVEKQAAIKALEILANCGCNEAIEIVEAPEELDILSQAKKLHGKELVDFMRENRAEYFKSLKK